MVEVKKENTLLYSCYASYRLRVSISQLDLVPRTMAAPNTNFPHPPLHYPFPILILWIPFQTVVMIRLWFHTVIKNPYSPQSHTGDDCLECRVFKSQGNSTVRFDHIDCQPHLLSMPGKCSFLNFINISATTTIRNVIFYLVRSTISQHISLREWINTEQRCYC